MTIQANPGPARWTGPRGYWRPKRGARLVWVGRREANPGRSPRWSSETTWAARLFVGLNVGEEPAWKIEDVVALAKKHWGRAASFVAQRGFWPSKDGLVEEDSVQVILINVGMPVKQFKDRVFDLAQALARDLRQEEVIVEFQKNGVVQRTLGVGA